MIDLNIRFQLAAFCFYLIIIFDYLKCRRNNLRSTRWFSVMLCFTGLYLVFDIATVITVNTVPDSFINRFFHQIFIGSLDSIIFSLCVYVELLCAKRKKIYYVLGSVPYIASMLMVLFGPLYFRHDAEGNYSYGPMADVLYISVTFYMTVVLLCTFRKRSAISSNKKTAIRVGAGIWIVSAVTQFIDPHLLLSGLSVVLVIMLLYLSFENTSEYYDVRTKTFSRKAYISAIDECFRRELDFYVVGVHIHEYGTYAKTLGQRVADEIVAKISEIINRSLEVSVYSTSEGKLNFITTDSSERLAVKLRVLKKKLSVVLEVDNMSIKIDECISILKCPEYAQDSDSILSIMDYLRHRKNESESSIHYIDEKTIEESNRSDKIKNIISSAIENDGFEVFYQPIYSTERQKFISAEALVRIKNTAPFNYLSPEEFIPISEKSGTIKQVGEIIFRKVCSFAMKEKLKEKGIEYIEVNLSGIQIMDTDLPGLLRSICSEYGIESSFINLEITETAAVSSADLLRDNMSRLRKHGFSFSMDDFGTGFSNLSQMADTDYDLVKLDKSLIWPCFDENLEHAQKAMSILDNVIVMLKSLGVHIVAEGVETEAMVEYLVMRKVHYLQGYYYSRPVPEMEFCRYIVNNNSISVESGVMK